ncbi:MAG: hypothetical protein R3A45_12495 [Bdellovibrionota bacterium]
MDRSTGDHTLSVGGTGDVLASMLTSFFGARYAGGACHHCKAVWMQHGKIGQLQN